VYPSYEAGCHRSIHHSPRSMQILLKGLLALKRAGAILQRKANAFQTENTENKKKKPLSNGDYQL